METMKKIIPFIMLASFGAIANPVKADIHHRMSSSVALEVNAAQTSVSRMGNSLSLTGNNVTTTVTPSGGSAAASLGGMAVATNGTATFTLPDATQTTAGSAFSYTVSTTQGDALDTTGPAMGDISAFSNQYSTAAGDDGDLAGTILTSGAMTLTAGGAGTNATGQFVSELSVR